MNLMQLFRQNAERQAPPKALAPATRNQAGAAQLFLYDVLDDYWGISAQAFVGAINAVPANDELHIHINSPGGDVFVGRTIATALRARPGKTVAYVDGLAASAATTVLMAAAERVGAQGSFVMIHNAWSLAMGDHREMTRTADLLQQVDGAIAADYVAATGATLEQVTAWMADETWFTAEDAKAQGFLTALASDASDTPADPQAHARTWNLQAYANVPQALTAPTPPAPDAAAVQAAARAQREAAERRLKLFDLRLRAA